MSKPKFSIGKCSACLKEVRIEHYKLKNKNHFCSRDCFVYFQKKSNPLPRIIEGSNDNIRVCQKCGKEIQGRKNSKFCSKECTKNKISVTCSNCGNEFKLVESQANKYKKHFCCNECKYEFLDKNKIQSHKGRSIKVNCENCGKETFTTNTQLAMNTTGRFYCGKECQGEYMSKLRGTQIKICPVCNKEHKVKKHELEMNHENYYCSKECAMVVFKKKYMYAKGENHILWKGNKDLFRSIRDSYKNTEWRISVYIKGNHKCVICGSKSDHAHHIKSLSSIIYQNKITTLDEALNCEELWDINNGVTVCKSCHKELHRKDKTVIKKRKYVYKNKKEAV